MFYQKDSVQVLNDLDSNLTGLTQEEVTSRLKNYGRNVLKEKPRNSQDSILNKNTISQITYEGIVIAICTMCAYLMGLKGDPLTASTMAFATICLARLLHGFNCRSDQPLT